MVAVYGQVYQTGADAWQLFAWWSVVLIGYAIAHADPIVHLFFWVTVSGGLGVLILMTLTSAAVIGFFGRDRLGENAEPAPTRELTGLTGLADTLEELVP